MNIATISKQIRAFADQLDATSEPEKPDPYAELKAAHAAGKVIQGLIGGYWLDSPHPTWKYPVDTYRVKPDEPVVCAVAKPEPAFQLPPPPPGMRWHREDGWKDDDLPSGYRPLVVGEKYVSGDEYRTKYSKDWHPETFMGTHTGSKKVTQSESSSLRTIRPLTFNHAGKTWTYHRPGDPMPCDGGSLIWALYDDGTPSLNSYCANDYVWGRVLGWRYAEPQTKTVPLGPEDVPPGSVFRHSEFKPGVHLAPSLVQVNGVTWIRKNMIADGCSTEFMAFSYLTQSWQINRSIPLNGKWNPNAWEPCSKTIPADDNLAEPKSR